MYISGKVLEILYYLIYSFSTVIVTIIVFVQKWLLIIFE